MARLGRAQRWDQTRPGLLSLAAIAWVLTYILALRAIDTGSLLEYAVALLLFVVGVRELVLAALRRKR